MEEVTFIMRHSYSLMSYTSQYAINVIDSSMRPFVHQRTANLPAPFCHQVDNLVYCKNKDEGDRYKVFQGCIAFCNLIKASRLFILH